uniref:DUF5581 domain-containing protein n=1 Tax=Pygocentrus nattereri TaxID=42514 RepID=A0A3B4BRB5_PYGNA
MKRNTNWLDSDLLGHSLSTQTHFTDPMENIEDPAKIQHHIRHILTKRLTHALIQTYNKKLELLRRCSFYIKIIQVDHSQHDHNHASSSTVMALIDFWRFQRMKMIGNNQVKIQLALLEELLNSLSRGHEKLQAISDQKGLDEGTIEEGTIKKKISKLLQEAAEFKDVLVPRRLHLKHHLISEVSSTRVPEIQLALSIKMPVRFDKTIVDTCLLVYSLWIDAITSKTVLVTIGSSE